MDKWDIARVVRRAGHLLSEALWEYEPTESQNEISENNITIHLAIASCEAGFKSYAECHWEGDSSRKIDMLLLHPRERLLALIECKRLYSAEKCVEVLNDLERILSFVPRGDDTKSFKRVGVLAATTWEGPIVRWWSTKKATAPTPSPVWTDLADHPGLKGAHWGCVHLRGFSENLESTPENDRAHHYLLYVVFDLPAGAHANK